MKNKIETSIRVNAYFQFPMKKPQKLPIGLDHGRSLRKISQNVRMTTNSKIHERRKTIHIYVTAWCRPNTKFHASCNIMAHRKVCKEPSKGMRRRSIMNNNPASGHMIESLLIYPKNKKQGKRKIN